MQNMPYIMPGSTLAIRSTHGSLFALDQHADRSQPLDRPNSSHAPCHTRYGPAGLSLTMWGGLKWAPPGPGLPLACHTCPCTHCWAAWSRSCKPACHWLFQAFFPFFSFLFGLGFFRVLFSAVLGLFRNRIQDICPTYRQILVDSRDDNEAIN